jgi:G protein beta subunit-like protein
MLQDAEMTRIVPICTFQAHRDYLTRILLSPDVKHLATCSADHTAKVWNLDIDYPPAKAAAAAVKARAKAGSEGSDSASTPASSSTPDQTDTVGNALDPNPFGIAEAPAPSEPQQSFPVQPDGPPMDPTQGTLFLETTLANHQRWVWDCAFSADSAYLVTVSSDHYARLWELASGQIIRQYSGHHRGAVCVALNDYSEPR